MNTAQLIHLIIDTSVLRAESYYKKEEYKTLEILVNRRIIKIYLPYIVENEYIEQLKEPYFKEFNSIKHSLKNLKKKYLTNIDEINNIEESIDTAEISTLNNVVKDFETNFCTKLNVKKLDIEPHHAKEVFNKYFKGTPPFKKQKNREDIPDAFIFECITSIKNKETNIVVLTRDDELSNACKENITIFKSLEDFIKHNEIQKVLIIEHKISNFIHYLESSNSVENFLEDYHIEDLENMTIESYKIRSDDNSAQITGIYTPRNIRCDFQNLVHYGNKKVGIPTIFDIDVDAHLLIYKGDYWAEEDYNSAYLEDWNDHYYSVENSYCLNIKSTVIIDMSQVDFSTSEIDFDEIADEIDISLNAIGDDDIEVI